MTTPTDSPEQLDSVGIRTEGLRKVYSDSKRGRVVALDGLDLVCQRGEIYGLLGPNGAGKTTCLRMLSSVLSPTAGKAFVDGVEVSQDPLEVRRRIGFLSTSTGLYLRLTGRETLRYFGELQGMQAQQLEQRIEELIHVFELSGFVDGPGSSFSTGQKQKLSIARAVLHEPPVLILDEPTLGLDILASSAMIEFISSARSHNTCVLFSTHIMSEAERLCDRIGIIYHGRLLTEGTYDQLREETGEEYLDGVFLSAVRRADEELEV